MQNKGIAIDPLPFDWEKEQFTPAQTRIIKSAFRHFEKYLERIDDRITLKLFLKMFEEFYK